MTNESTGWFLQLQPLVTLMFCQYWQAFSCSTLKIVRLYWWFIHSVTPNCHHGPKWHTTAYPPHCHKRHINDRPSWRIVAREYSRQTPAYGFNMGSLSLQAFHQARRLLSNCGNDQRWRSHCHQWKLLIKYVLTSEGWASSSPFFWKHGSGCVTTSGQCCLWGKEPHAIRVLCPPVMAIKGRHSKNHSSFN